MTENEALKRAVGLHREFNRLDTWIGLEFCLIDNIWTRDGGTFFWNIEDDKEDLYCGSFKTYSVEIWNNEYEDDDFIMIFADDGYGNRGYYLFLKEKEV